MRGQTQADAGRILLSNAQQPVAIAIPQLGPNRGRRHSATGPHQRQAVHARIDLKGIDPQAKHIFEAHGLVGTHQAGRVHAQHSALGCESVGHHQGWHTLGLGIWNEGADIDERAQTAVQAFQSIEPGVRNSQQICASGGRRGHQRQAVDAGIDQLGLVVGLQHQGEVFTLEGERDLQRTVFRRADAAIVVRVANGGQAGQSKGCAQASQVQGQCAGCRVHLEQTHLRDRHPIVLTAIVHFQFIETVGGLVVDGDIIVVGAAQKRRRQARLAQQGVTDTIQRSPHFQTSGVG